MKTTFAALAATFAVLPVFGFADSREFRPGDPFPELRLPLASDGSLMSTAELRGSRTVLHIFAGW